MSVLVLAPARWARLREVQGRRDDGIANSNHPWDHRWSRPPPSSLSSSSLLIARRVGDSREFVSHHPRDLADVKDELNRCLRTERVNRTTANREIAKEKNKKSENALKEFRALEA
ncbi:hypothetical protein CC1G_13969 [Coprinopsis cinerea okayama7|uniref:Uncharacterized protein n=1 Tax=Coprinopsis cinerea (strain Okayama-7 / 130 / ATCC MYA-4618 / FGSC 9003) TaxID=240176 RepID=D6RKI5_COPC7|nr:hypothetical protein CC1G_13969 [Coprinopsis cinerea okayama7\|eukprot:XP_002911930.1 hypothetical protein CC1G_13969 [Coprinopsis cinerea okayama7\